ncbi:MAG: hypothetical protein NXH97_15590 [Rhodobacteraceae bacterium]|nr:hypothetical protein [Paracoccaceae bacterium]
MELGPGRYGFDDLTPGAWFSTVWVDVTPDAVARFSALTGIPAGDTVPPLLLLALVEGAKQSGPVQIAAELLRGWRVSPEAPVRAGTRVRGRYEVVGLRRGLLTLALRIETDAGATAVTAEARLVLS